MSKRNKHNVINLDDIRQASQDKINKAVKDIARAAEEGGFSKTSASVQKKLEKKLNVTEAEVFSYADVKATKVEWIWPGYLPVGCLTLVYGNMGIGKSLVTLDIAARISRGKAWPTGEKNTQGRVIMLAQEDSRGRIKARLDLLGADARQISGIGGVFALDQDIEKLRDECRKKQPRVVIIDPINNYLGRADSFKDPDVRRVLMPLAELAQEFKIAVIALTHMGKNDTRDALHRPLGSVAFMSVPRSALLVAYDPDDEEANPNLKRRLVAQTKQQDDALGRTLAFYTKKGPTLEWDRAGSDLWANSVLRKRDLSTPSRTDEAEKFLNECFAKTECLDAKETTEKAEAAGLSERVLGSARKRLHVVVTRVRDKKRGHVKGATWELPATF